jgi:hypothetical protein
MIRRVSKKRQRELRKKIPQLQQGYGARPPKEWWNGMLKIVKQGYPNRNLQAQSRIAAGIWHSYSPQAKISIIRRLARGSGGIPREENPQRSQYWQTHRKWTREEKKEYKKFLKSREPKRRVYGPTWAPPLVEDYLSGEFDPMEQNPIHTNIGSPSPEQFKKMKPGTLIFWHLTPEPRTGVLTEKPRYISSPSMGAWYAKVQWDDYPKGQVESVCLNRVGMEFLVEKDSMEHNPIGDSTHINNLNLQELGIPKELYYQFETDKITGVLNRWKIIEVGPTGVTIMIVPRLGHPRGMIRYQQNSLRDDILGAHYYSFMTTTKNVKGMVKELENTHTFDVQADYEDAGTVKVRNKNGKVVFWAICKGGDVWIVRHPEDLFQPDSKVITEQNPYYYKLYPPYDVFHSETPLAGGDIIGPFKTEHGAKVAQEKRARLGVEQNPLTCDKCGGQAKIDLGTMLKFCVCCQQFIRDCTCKSVEKNPRTIEEIIITIEGWERTTYMYIAKRQYNKAKEALNMMYNIMYASLTEDELNQRGILDRYLKLNNDIKLNIENRPSKGRQIHEQNPLLSPQAAEEFARRQTQRQPQLPVQYTGHQEPRTVYWIAGRDTPLQQMRIQILIRELENIYHKKIIVVERHTSSIKGGGRVPSGWEFQVVG